MGIKELVFQALDNARANGFNPCEDTSVDIAQDLADFDADLEGKPASELTPHILEWKKANCN
jgi:hypothetical protein